MTDRPITPGTAPSGVDRSPGARGGAVVVELPLPPNRGNERGKHWAVDRRERRNFQLCCTAMHPARLDEPFEFAVVHAHFRTWNPCDEDNLVARLKPAWDWLVDRGFLMDDHPSCAKLGRVTQEIDRKNRGLTLTLEGS